MKKHMRAACAAPVIVICALIAGCDRRQSDWESARKADTAAAYGDFLKRYPDGDFVSQAKARLAEIQQEEDWKSAISEDTAQGYQHFVTLHPEGAHADEARIRVENLNLAAAPAETAAAASPAAPATTKPAAPAKQSPPAEKPPLPAAAGGHYRIQLGAFSSETRARSEWQQATKAHASQLAGLGYTLAKTKSGGATLYRLQSTGMPESRARSICAALTARRQACVVVPP